MSNIKDDLERVWGQIRPELRECITGVKDFGKGRWQLNYDNGQTSGVYCMATQHFCPLQYSDGFTESGGLQACDFKEYELRCKE